MEFERRNVYELTLTHPLDRIRFKGPVPPGMQEVSDPMEPVEQWDVIEASFYENGLAEFRLAQHNKTEEGFEKTERHWLAAVTAPELLGGDQPDSEIATLVVSLGVDELTGPAAQEAVWRVFEQVVLYSDNRPLRTLLPGTHWLIGLMDAIHAGQAETRSA